MRIPHRWLASLCEHGLAPEGVAEVLQSLGHEVAGVEALPGGDAAIELEITANRPDCLSVLGLAHELSASTGKPVRMPDLGVVPSGDPVRAEVESAADCPRYTLRAVRGLRTGPSPAPVRERLEASGMKPVSNVVDVTNLVLLELGQPLHAFDAAKVRGHLRVRRARQGERLRTLDGADRALEAGMLVIADEAGPVALAGILGGEASAVSASTREVLLESAVFDPGVVRRTARALKLQTDASYRFERGVDPEGVLRASDRAARMLQELAGGVPGPVCAVGAAPEAPAPFRLRAVRLKTLLGFEVPAAEVRRALEGLGCAVSEAPGGWEVRPPSRRRRDLRIEAEAAEEVARVWGYHRIPSRTGLPLRIALRDPARDLATALSERLRAAGFSEAVTTSFSDARGARSQARGVFPLGESLALRNPMSSEQTHLRRSLLPGLLACLAHNQNVGEGAVRLFEAGRVYGSAPTEPLEAWSLALAGSGDLRAFRGAIEAALGEPALRAEPGEAGEPFEPGRSVLLKDGDRTVGVLGAASSVWTRALDLPEPPVLAELSLDWALSRRLPAPGFRPLPRFPGVSRDLAVVVDDGVPWAKVEAAVLSVPCAFRESVALFDVYRGKQAGEGRKSLAFSVRFRHPDRTLTGEEVDAVMAATASALEAACGASVRR